MTPSLSARLPRPTGRPRVPNAGPAPVLALWPAAALAPGRVAAHVWHGQTRLGERFHLRCERSAAVTAVASARQECAQLLCLLHFSNMCMHNLRIGQRVRIKKKKTKLTKRGKGKSHDERRQEVQKERNDGAPRGAAGKGRAT